MPQTQPVGLSHATPDLRAWRNEREMGRIYRSASLSNARFESSIVCLFGRVPEARAESCDGRNARSRNLPLVSPGP